MSVLLILCLILSFATENSGYTTGCPAHTDQVHQFNNIVPFKACRPSPCRCLNGDSTDFVDCRSIIRSRELTVCMTNFTKFVRKFQDPSCHWVRLVKDQDFIFDVSNGSIFENETENTYSFNEYAYNPEYKEAYICRENLRPNDKTDGIILWCSILTVTENYDFDSNGWLMVPGLAKKISPKYYSVNNNSSTVSICYNTSMDHLRGRVLLDRTNDPFYINDNFSLVLKGHNGHNDTLIPPENYWLSDDGTIAIVSGIPNEASSSFTNMLYIFHIISTVFCFFTLVIHLALPKINFHTKSLLCHVLSMMLMYIAFTLRRFFYDVKSKTELFLLFGFFYVTTMGTFLWLNIIAYELWKVFASLRGTETKSIEHQVLRLILKSLYAWGIPLVVLGIIVGISYDKKGAELFGITSSFPSNQHFNWIFIHGPITVILLINLVFFIFTIWNISKARKGTKMLNKNVKRKLFLVFVKLFIVMGILWLADIGSSWAEKSNEHFFYFFDVINALQGLAVFIIYVCKKSTFKMIRRRYRGEDNTSISTTKSSIVSRSRFASTSSANSSCRENAAKRQNDAEESFVLSNIQPLRTVD